MMNMNNFCFLLHNGPTTDIPKLLLESKSHHMISASPQDSASWPRRPSLGRDNIDKNLRRRNLSSSFHSLAQGYAPSITFPHHAHIERTKIPGCSEKRKPWREVRDLMDVEVVDG
jgi:hypothetical protein